MEQLRRYSHLDREGKERRRKEKGKERRRQGQGDRHGPALEEVADDDGIALLPHNLTQPLTNPVGEPSCPKLLSCHA